MEKEKTTKKIFNASTYALVVAFLCLEVLAFISFSLAQNYILWGSLSLALAILLFLVTFRQIKKDGVANFAYFLFPLFVYGLLSALSPFVTQSNGAIGIANGVFIPITFTFIALCGFFSGHIKGFDLQKVFLVVYGALAVYVLINFIATMVYYVPFYTLIYSNSYIYFDGRPSSVPIGQTAYALFGFEILEVSLVYWSLFPSILLSSCIGLFFIKYKNNKKLFLTYLSFTIMGGICLLFTISKESLIGDLVLILSLGLIVLAMKFKKSHKPIKITLLVLLILFLLGCILLALNAQTNWAFLEPMQNAISNNSFLNRLFNTNRFVKPVISILWEMFNFGKIFGSFVGYVLDAKLGFVEQNLSGYSIFDNLLTSGLFGSLFLILGFVFCIKQMLNYLNKDIDLPVNKWLLVSYVFITLTIVFFAYDGTPLVNADNLYPVYMFTPLLISIFLISYTFRFVKEPNTIKNEEVIEDEKTFNL